jgi:hypothetical protein
MGDDLIKSTKSTKLGGATFLYNDKEESKFFNFNKAKSTFIKYF